MKKIISTVVAMLMAFLAFRAEARNIEIELYDWNADHWVVSTGHYNSIAWGFQPVRFSDSWSNQWILEPASNGWYVVRNRFAGRLLTVNTTNWTVVTHPRYVGPGYSWEQLWRIDGYRLRNGGGSCLKTKYANGTTTLGLGSCSITGTATWWFGL